MVLGTTLRQLLLRVGHPAATPDGNQAGRVPESGEAGRSDLTILPGVRADRQDRRDPVRRPVYLASFTIDGMSTSP